LCPLAACLLFIQSAEEDSAGWTESVAQAAAAVTVTVTVTGSPASRPPPMIDVVGDASTLEVEVAASKTVEVGPMAEELAGTVTLREPATVRSYVESEAS
jgi:hypothetical protein